MGDKQCRKCCKMLPSSDFYLRTGKANSYHSACKACERLMAKDWYERNKDITKAKVKEWRWRHADAVKKYRADNRYKHYRQEVVRKYGVSINWFDDQINRQGNACTCCGLNFQFGNKKTTPHVDHCHKTQLVRGILCNRCNTVLGLCDDDSTLLSTLSGYLRKCHG